MYRMFLVFVIPQTGGGKCREQGKCRFGVLRLEFLSTVSGSGLPPPKGMKGAIGCGRSNTISIHLIAARARIY